MSATRIDVPPHLLRQLNRSTPGAHGLRPTLLVTGAALALAATSQAIENPTGQWIAWTIAAGAFLAAWMVAPRNWVRAEDDHLRDTVAELAAFLRSTGHLSSVSASGQNLQGWLYPPLTASPVRDPRPGWFYVIGTDVRGREIQHQVAATRFGAWILTDVTVTPTGYM